MGTAHLFRSDPLPHLKPQVARQAFEFVERFCRAADRKMMRSREEAFLMALNEWMHYAACGNKIHAARWEKEMDRLSVPAG